MKTYQVWAIPVNRAEGDTSLWHQLGETNDLTEAFFWKMTADNGKIYSETQITQAVNVRLELQ